MYPRSRRGLPGAAVSKSMKAGSPGGSAIPGPPVRPAGRSWRRGSRRAVRRPVPGAGRRVTAQRGVTGPVTVPGGVDGRHREAVLRRVVPGSGHQPGEPHCVHGYHLLVLSHGLRKNSAGRRGPSHGFLRGWRGWMPRSRSTAQSCSGRTVAFRGEALRGGASCASPRRMRPGASARPSLVRAARTRRLTRRGARGVSCPTSRAPPHAYMRGRRCRRPLAVATPKGSSRAPSTSRPPPRTGGTPPCPPIGARPASLSRRPLRR